MAREDPERGRFASVALGFAHAAPVGWTSCGSTASITSRASRPTPRNVDFYTRVLGLRLVKKTVNQDDPTVYHLFYADEAGTPGSDITFFEYPGIQRGRAGAGMVHTVGWRLGSDAALDLGAAVG